MEEHVIFTRIKHRIDTAANWANTTDIPLPGELIIYAAEGDIPTKLKIGDGVHTASNLPFITDVDSDGLAAGVRIPESDTNTVGSESQPIYWNNGRPYAVKYDLQEIVDSIPEFATDEEVVAMMIEEGILSVVHTEDGEVLATDESSILML